MPPSAPSHPLLATVRSHWALILLWAASSEVVYMWPFNTSQRSAQIVHASRLLPAYQANQAPVSGHFCFGLPEPLMFATGSSFPYDLPLIRSNVPLSLA